MSKKKTNVKAKARVVNKDGFMLLMLGALAVLIGGYFFMTSVFVSRVKAENMVITKGILLNDSNHAFPCNKTLKAQYVLRDLSLTDKCTPVVANADLAKKFIGKKLVLSGTSSGGAYYATGFKAVLPKGK